jgi:hypothetical protein
MPSSHAFFTFALHIFKLRLLCSFESNLPCVFNNREEVLQFAKTGLNEIRGFVKVFKPKIKRK